MIKRIGGTYGYMSPKYAMNGQFSLNYDVYSFGVLLLELIIGKKNSFFNQEDKGEGIACYAWKNWRDGTPLLVLDPVIGERSLERGIQLPKLLDPLELVCYVLMKIQIVDPQCPQWRT